MRMYINSRIDYDGSNGIGVETFDLLGVGAESEKQKAESGENAASHLFFSDITGGGPSTEMTPSVIL